MSARTDGKLTLWPGVGLVAANMIGAGVLLSSGFMAQEMGPGAILAAWGVGAVLALAGARAYAELARLVPRSGGEYRYLSELLHPSLGFQLVKVESGFKSKARSPAGALGYTQVRLRTARMFDSTLTERVLLEPETNLRTGFRILRRLLRQFDYDLELALRAYNLGPTGAVASLADTTSTSAYAKAVMEGVKGTIVRKKG